MKAMDGLPMQPIEKAADGVVRFRENRIVRALLEAARVGQKLDLNDIAIMGCEGKFSKAEQMQLAQLIGYSIDGFAELNYSSRKVISAADKKAEMYR